MNIEQSILDKSIDFENYYKIVESLVNEGKTSGKDQSDFLIEYTSLNLQRMKRLNKTFKPSEEAIKTLKELDQRTIWLVMTEAWCGDAAQIVPIMNKLAMESEHIELRLLWRDENLEIMDQFLTNGGRSIPKLIGIDQMSNEVLYDWGPRPAKAQDLHLENKKNPDPEFKTTLHMWYAKDKGRSTEKELLQLIT